MAEEEVHEWPAVRRDGNRRRSKSGKEHKDHSAEKRVSEEGRLLLLERVRAKRRIVCAKGRADTGGCAAV